MLPYIIGSTEYKGVGTRHNISVPSGLQSGDLLIAQCVAPEGTLKADGVNSRWLSEWFTGELQTMKLIADGTEGPSIDVGYVSGTTARRCHAIVVAIRGASSSILVRVGDDLWPFDDHFPDSPIRDSSNVTLWPSSWRTVKRLHFYVGLLGNNGPALTGAPGWGTVRFGSHIGHTNPVLDDRMAVATNYQYGTPPVDPLPWNVAGKSAMSIEFAVREGNPATPGPCSIGMNVSNVPEWESRCWENSGWRLDGAGGIAIAPEFIGAIAWQQGGSGNPDGPYNHGHIARIRFQHNLGADPVTAGPRFISYEWKGPTQRGKVTLQFGDSTNTATRVELTTGSGVVTAPFTFIPNTEYILEFDSTVALGVRLALAADIESATDLLTGPYIEGANSPTEINLTAYRWSGDGLIVKHIDMRLGEGATPPAGQSFKRVLIGVGDGTTTTFLGFPTVTDSSVWEIDGIVVEPASIDETTGSVTFDRPPAWLSNVRQSGTAV